VTTVRRRLVPLLAVALLAPVFPSAAPAAAAPGDAGDWAARRISSGGLRARDRDLAASLPGAARLGYHPETGRVRFISGTPRKPLGGGVATARDGRRTLSGADARSRARRFLGRYGRLFGVRDAAGELRVRGTRRALAAPAAAASAANDQVAAGLPNVTVRFGQVRDGIEVLGGEIVVQVGANGEVISAAGEVLPSAAKPSSSSAASTSCP